MADAPVVLPSWVLKKKKDTSSELYKMYFFLMKELHLSYDDLVNMPVPAIFVLAEELAEYNKEQEKQLKKQQRKK